MHDAWAVNVTVHILLQCDHYSPCHLISENAKTKMYYWYNACIQILASLANQKFWHQVVVYKIVLFNGNRNNFVASETQCLKWYCFLIVSDWLDYPKLEYIVSILHFDWLSLSNCPGCSNRTEIEGTHSTPLTMVYTSKCIPSGQSECIAKFKLIVYLQK